MPLLTVGHRGLMGVEPENTLRAFRGAERAGLHAVELDLRLSRDGALVVMHDAEVDRTTDGSGPVGSLTVAQLRGLDAGGGERVPLFAEVVAAVATPIQAEIKDRAAADVLAGALRAPGLRERVTVTSFHDEALARVAALLPGAALGLVTGRGTRSAPERAARLGAGLVSCELAHLDADVVARCRAAGVRVLSWTVNTAAELARVRELGLDGVVTDWPQIARAAAAGATGAA